MRTIYKAKLDNGYAEFLTREEAEAVSNTVEVIQRESRSVDTEAVLIKQQILKEILALEGDVTPRKLRDAVLTEDGRAWLQNQEGLIQVQRYHLQEINDRLQNTNGSP